MLQKKKWQKSVSTKFNNFDKKKRRYCQFGNNIAMINLTDALIKYAYCPVIKLAPENTERMQIMSCESIQQNAFKAVYANKIEHIFLSEFVPLGVWVWLLLPKVYLMGNILNRFHIITTFCLAVAKGIGDTYDSK